MKLKIIAHTEETGGYWAEVPALPGCVTQGETMAELRANLREAVSAVLEVRAENAPHARAHRGVREMEMAL